MKSIVAGQKPRPGKLGRRRSSAGKPHLPPFRPAASIAPYGPGRPLNGPASRPPEPTAKAAVRPSLASERGRLLAEGFARIGAAGPVTADDVDRAQSFRNAVERGRRESADDAARMQELMNDEDYLIGAGFAPFGGRNDDE